MIRIRLQNELLFLNILTILLIIIITVIPSSVFRIILGLPFLLFFPGYTLTAALFPRRDALNNVGRVALSFGLSIAVVPLIGIILNYTPWGITLYPILISITILILATSVVTWYRRWRLAEAEKFTVSLNLILASWKRQNFVDKILSVILIVTILGATGALGYAIAVPKDGERFTEFYISGPEGKAADYPKELKIGETGWVTVSIINHEHRLVAYRVEVEIDGVTNNEMGPVMLEHDGKWEPTIGITLRRPGNNQKVEFLLYKNGGSQAYLTFHFWVDVKE